MQATPKVSGEVVGSHPSLKSEVKSDNDGVTPREQAPLYFEEAQQEQVSLDVDVAPTVPENEPGIPDLRGQHPVCNQNNMFANSNKPPLPAIKEEDEVSDPSIADISQSLRRHNSGPMTPYRPSGEVEEQKEDF